MKLAMSVHHIAITDMYTVVQSNFMVAAHDKFKTRQSH